jgi:sulfite reductase alpha subunit-like flavoprotein
MIAAGAGIAPFRAFLEESVAEGCKRHSAALFFGCRGKNIDCLYHEEMRQHVETESAALSRLIMAFSRSGQEIRYVQHQLLARATAVNSLFQKGANIYVCGSSRMGRAVRETMLKVLDAQDAKLLMQDGRYVEELW